MLVDRLRRVTRDGQWIREIDGLRFVAISSVLLFHLYGTLTTRPEYHLAIEPAFGWLGGALGQGGHGVNLFFVISGIILALPFARHFLGGNKPVSLQKYYLRRVTRLEPPYILSLLLVATANFVYWHRLAPGFFFHLLASIFYMHNQVFGTRNGVSWTLEIEIQFYTLAPLFAQCYRIRSVGMRRVLLLASILAIPPCLIPFSGNARVELSIIFYLHYFLMGLLLADIFLLDLPKIKPTWICDLAGVAALILIFWPGRPLYLLEMYLPLPIGILCFAAMRSHILRKVLSNTWIAVIGGMCYSIYLIHFPIVSAILKVTRIAIIPSAPFAINFMIQVLLDAVPTVILCAVYFVLVERPCMDPNWPSELWHAVTGRRESEVAMLDTSIEKAQ